MWPVFQKAFYDSRRTIFWLAVGLGFYAIFAASLFPAIAENGDSYNEMIDNMPEEFAGLFGGDAASLDFTTPDAFISVEFFIWTVLILGAVVIIQAFNALTNAERDGTLDVLLAFPISRRAMLVGRFLNTLVTQVVVLTAIFLTLWASTFIWSEFDLGVGELLAMSYGPLVILVPTATFCYALATVVPSSKRWAGTLAYTLFYGMYFVHGLAGTSEAIKGIQPFMLFDYYNALEMSREGLDVLKVAVMGVFSVLLAGVAWWRVDEKELGV